MINIANRTHAERFGEHIRVHGETDRLVSTNILSPLARDDLDRGLLSLWLATAVVEA
jgi:hypothetical protein